MRIKASPDKVLVMIMDTLMLVTFIAWFFTDGIDIILKCKELLFINNGEDVFQRTNIINLLMNTSVFIVIISILITSIFIWYKNGKDDKVKEVLGFYPPSNLNSAEVGAVYRGSAKDKEVITLLIHLINEGYIRILKENGDIKLQRLKDYEGSDLLKKTFFEGMFKSKNSQDNTLLNEVKYENLYNKLYNTVDDVVFNLNTRDDIMPNFTQKSISENKNFYLLCFLVCVIMFLPLISYMGIFQTFFLGIFSTAMTYILLEIILLSFISRQNIVMLVFVRMYCIYSIIMEILPETLEYLFPVVLGNGLLCINYFAGTITIITILILTKFMTKRIGKNKENYEKELGFRTFLKNSTIPEIKNLMNETPNYYYDMIPYAYALGVENEWFSKINDLNLSRPFWCGYDVSLNDLKKEINESLKLMNDAASIRPSDRLI